MGKLRLVLAFIAAFAWATAQAQTQPPTPISMLPSAGAPTGPDLFYLVQGGISKKVTFSGLETSLTGAFLPLTGGTVTGDAFVTAVGGLTAANAYSVCPAVPSANSCIGALFSSTQDIVYLSGGCCDARAVVAIYDTTTLNNDHFETALYINYNVSSGYCTPPASPCDSRAALQISMNANSGGGNAWDAAMSGFFNSGWAGSNGNFGVILELDPTNNDPTANTDPVTVTPPFTSIIGLWLAGAVGNFPITSYLTIGPSSTNGTNYASYIGIEITGSYVDEAYDFFIHNTGPNIAGFFDSGAHNYAISLSGAYAGAAINIGETSGSGIGISMITNESICFNGSSDCMAYVGANSAVVFNGPVSFTGLTTGTATQYLCLTSTHQIIAQNGAC